MKNKNTKANNPGKIVACLNHEISRVLDPNLSEYNITGNQCGFLLFLLSRTDTDTYQRDIEIEFNLRRSSATSVLKVMEKRGLIRRVSDSTDGRLKRILITEKGVNLGPIAERIIREFEAKLCQNIPQDDLDTAMRVIQLMKINLEKVKR